MRKVPITNFFTESTAPVPSLSVPEIRTSNSGITVTKVFEDPSSDCIVCMSTEKDVVFASCGHYCACFGCATKIKTSTGKCPICRSSIIAIVKRDQIQI